MRVLILGLDTFSAKNVAQIRLLGERGYTFDIVTADWRGQSERWFSGLGGAHRLFILRGGIAARIGKVWWMLRSGAYAHAELYAAGRLAWLYVALLRVTRTRFIVVERGDVALLGTYDWLTRRALTAAYRHADVVVYKETYMPDLLRRYGPKSLEFLPNCVEARDGAAPKRAGGAFLWANRIIPQRRPEWLVRAFAEPALAGRALAIVGFETRAGLFPAVAALQAYLRGQRPENVTLHDYTDLEPFYRSATFFCFPAEHVFGNNALLEAMSHGLIPIVNDAPGVELIVQDGVNGIVTAFDERAYRDGLLRAAALDDAEVHRLSTRAIETVESRYSVAAWVERLDSIYRRLHC